MARAILSLIAVMLGIVWLGGLNQNFIGIVGVLLTIIAGLVTICTALSSRFSAAKLEYEPTEETAERKSATFRTGMANIMGVDQNKSEAARLRTEMLEVTQALESDVKALQFQVTFMKRHIQICFDNLRYHEEITIPKAIAGSSGVIVVSTLLAILGTIMAGFDELVYAIAQHSHAQINSWVYSALIRAL